MTDQLFEPTLDEQIAEVKREIALRERVYPRWVQEGKRSQHACDRAMRNMRAVLATLVRLQEDGK